MNPEASPGSSYAPTVDAQCPVGHNFYDMLVQIGLWLKFSFECIIFLM